MARGTQRTAVRMLGSPGYAYVAGAWREEPPASKFITVDFPPPLGRVTAVSFPSAEVFTIPWHVSLREVRVFMRVPPVAARLLSGLSPILPAVGHVVAAVAPWFIGAGTEGPDDAGRAASRIQIAVDARGVKNGKATRRRVLLAGADPYGLTAVIAVSGAERMTREGFAAAGVLAPASVVEPQAFLESLKPAGVTYDESEE